METFLYGHYAHVNKDKVEKFLKWKQSGPLFFFLMKTTFMDTLVAILSVIAFVKLISEAELAGDLASRLAGDAAEAQVGAVTP